MKLKLQRTIYMLSRYFIYGFLVQLMFISLVSAGGVHAQFNRIDEVEISLGKQEMTLGKFFRAVENSTDFQFSFDRKDINRNLPLHFIKGSGTIEELLTQVARQASLSFKQVNHNIDVKKVEREKADRVDIAEEVSISGTVTDTNGEPIPGVTVSIQGGTTGTITDLDGNYSIDAPEGSTLVFSFIGFAKVTKVVGNQSTINVVMKEDISNLDEVVVIGYGTQRKADITSAVSTVKSDDFVQGGVNDAGQLLQGKVAGLTVSAPSGDPTSGSQILLRGNTTLYGANSDPLVLIDGIPGNLNTVAPEDIESIDVLKDGSAAAIYGTRGTNGVILVTTKRASGEYSSSFDYQGYMSTQTIARELDMLTAEDYREQIEAGERDASWDLGGNTNWMDEVTQTPISHVHNMTFRGGNEKTNYLANANYRDFEGIFKKSNNNTLNLRTDINHNMLDDKLKLNIGLLHTLNKYTTTADGGSFNGYTYRQALIRNPTAPVRNEDGTWHEQPSIFNYENPMARLFESDGENSSQNTRINTKLIYTPINNLKLSAVASLNTYNQVRGYSETKQHISTLRDGRNGYASNGTTYSKDKLLELTGEYTTFFGDHTLSILGGYGYQENEFREFWMQNWDFPTDRFGYNNIGTGNALREGLAPISSYKANTNLISFFSRLSYNYMDKYLLLASVRHEAASQLYGTDQPWGTFPAVSLGWRISNESFMEDLSFVKDLKLRAGYGVTGTQPADLFLGVAMLGYDRYLYSNGNWIRALSPIQNPNPNLRWEEKKETNIGLDFTLFDGRVSGNVDYYKRKIDGLLYDYDVPTPPNLFNRTRANVGVMENQGWEALLNIIAIQNKDFQWTTSFNFSTNSNKLVSLSNEQYQATQDYFTAGGTGEPIQTFTHIVKIGDNIGDFYGFKVVDIDENGKWIYETPGGETVGYDEFNHSFEEKQVLGNGLPKYYAGWNNNIKYKNWDLAITMRGAFDYQILNFQRMYYENPTLQQYNQLKSSQDLVFGKAKFDAPLEFNSYYIEDGDFWKIDNVTLGYNFPISNHNFLKSARVYASSLNTLILTGYSGIDPEVNRLGLSPGNDSRDKYPNTRTFTLGINLSF
ncbi:TonB-dependent receptor [Echinicola jeungdonensis]|uniref:SusC/RagA family TonB-linked outer membrane protein n=1 Tax=Echinicola jeungdonensis TaxID=709343 RepID=A0ABV5J4W7_9BACT|nr:TonB-dependent receptor [Echinicola jeungdonensis]MDN3670701.1 TonB-dependent receptor [Echinicola jeungdonensis]